MATVDFKLEDVGKLIEASEQRLQKQIEETVSASEKRLQQQIQEKVTDSEKRLQKQIVETVTTSEERVVKAVKETFDVYDAKFAGIKSVQRKHSADIAELQAAMGI